MIIVKPRLNFDLNFSFKFFWFYRTTEKVTKIKLVMVIVNLHILVTILFFHDFMIQAY